MKTKLVQIKTSSNKQVLDITDVLENYLLEQPVSEGVLLVNILHTTAALSMADLDPGTDLDMLDAFYAMIPELDFRHPHNPDHTPDHILATLIGSDISVPVSKGGLLMGTWQRPVLFEFDGPRDRKLVINQISS